MLGYSGLVLEQVRAAHVHLRGATLQGQGSSLPFVPSWVCPVPPVPLMYVRVVAVHVCG